MPRSRFQEPKNLWHGLTFSEASWIGQMQDLAFSIWNWTVQSLWKGPWYLRLFETIRDESESLSTKASGRVYGDGLWRLALLLHLRRPLGDEILLRLWASSTIRASSNICRQC